MNTLNVFYEKVKVGELSRNEDLVYSFTYTSDWLNYEKKFPLSLALPLRKEPYGNKHTLSFFENLLPEGEVRNVIERTHQVESSYEFLREFGQDCAGAVIVTDKKRSPFTGNIREKILIDMDKVYQAIEQHHSVANVIAEMDPGYLSLAGAQDKFPAIFEDKKFYLPKDATPTTHIVKVPINRSGVKESVYNEYYCMQLAKAVGLNVPHSQIVGDGAHPLFVIERYDREKDKNGIIHRIHQQDFCQAQGIVSEQKYEAKGGPSLKDNYTLIINNVSIKNRLNNTYAFLDWICFNLIIGNNDSHSKNISFLLRDNKIELAPFYDLLSTSIYPKLKRQFSFKIGGRDDSSRIGKNQLEALDAELALKAGTMSARLKLMNKKIFEHKDLLADEIKKEHKEMKIAHRISEMIEDRSRGFKQQGLEL